MGIDERPEFQRVQRAYAGVQEAKGQIALSSVGFY